MLKNANYLISDISIKDGQNKIEKTVNLKSCNPFIKVTGDEDNRNLNVKIIDQVASSNRKWSIEPSSEVNFAYISLKGIDFQAEFILLENRPILIFKHDTGEENIIIKIYLNDCIKKGYQETEADLIDQLIRCPFVINRITQKR